MRIAVSSDERVGVAERLVADLRGRGHELVLHGALAEGARRWNDANVLALTLRAVSDALLEEILDAWFAARPSAAPEDRANVEHLAAIAGTLPTRAE